MVGWLGVYIYIVYIDFNELFPLENIHPKKGVKGEHVGKKKQPPEKKYLIFSITHICDLKNVFHYVIELF